MRQLRRASAWTLGAKMKLRRLFSSVLLLLMVGHANAESGTRVTVLADALCDAGYEMVRGGAIEKGVSILSDCIISKDVSAASMRRAYIGRAWANKTLGKMNEAISDQEAALKLAPASYGELINYALYLRYAGRAAESIKPLKTAEAMDEAKGWASMMTQYQLGWSYQELGKHEEAVAAFSKGIPQQANFAFAYYRRGLSFEALGKKDAARADFQNVAALLQTADRGKVSDKELPDIKRKLADYGIH